MTLMSSVIFAVGSAASGSRSFSILRTQEVAIANLGVMALALHASMESTRSHEEIEATVIALCSVGTALVGMGLYAIGRFSLTRYLRFVPDCVVSGYLASVGFLLLKSGFLALIGSDGFGSPLSGPDAVSRLIAGGFLALLLLLVESRSRSRVTAPLLILAAIVLFQIIIRSSGLSIGFLEHHGWVVATAPKEIQNLPPLPPGRLREVDWTALLGQAPAMVFLVLTSALGEMLALAGIERASPEAHKVDTEFKNAGATNLLVALLGSVPGYHSPVHTLLALRFRAPRRIVAVVTGLVCLLALVSGKPFLQLMPWPLFGGMLLWMGAAGLKDWFFRGLLEMKRAHAIVKALILFVVVTFGFYQGMIFGALAGAFLFILEYARTGVVRLQISGRDYHSSLTQFDDRRLAAIKELGDAIVILRLKGYVFFGSAHGLRERVQEALAHDRRLECIVIDFEEVAGVDGAAAMALEAIGRDARAAGVEIMLCGLSEELQRSIAGQGLDLSSDFRFFGHLDQCLRFAEDAVFSRHRPSVVAQEPVSVFAWLRQATDSDAPRRPAGGRRRGPAVRAGGSRDPRGAAVRRALCRRPRRGERRDDLDGRWARAARDPRTGRALRRARLSFADAALRHGPREDESRRLAPFQKRARGARRGGAGGGARLPAFPGGAPRRPGSGRQSTCALSFPLRPATLRFRRPGPSPSALLGRSRAQATDNHARSMG